jgi:2-dehydropantoate 2-reductase
MKIAIIGTGGVGGYYGALLARHGQQVTFFARGAHLEAIRRNGLQIKSLHGDFNIQPAHAVETAEGVGTVDLVLVCTKTYATQTALSLLEPLLAPQTVVISLQNGVDAAQRIGTVIGMQHMLGGTTWLSSAIESPGVIRQVSRFHRIVLGELDGRLSDRLEAVAQVFRPTGITLEVTGDIHKVLWTKFIFIAGVSGIGALTRLDLGAYRSVPETRRLLSGLMAEVEMLARQQGVNLDPDVLVQTLAFIDNAAPHLKPSMQRDVETGNLFELESIIGVIGRLGSDCGLPTPIADMIYAALLPVSLQAEKQAGS